MVSLGRPYHFIFLFFISTISFLILKKCIKEPIPDLFLANILILYPKETSGKLQFSGIFRGYEMGILDRNGLIWYDPCRQLHVQS